eukprot:9075216-Pyramimonas_sp.AAC.1
MGQVSHGAMTVQVNMSDRPDVRPIEVFMCSVVRRMGTYYLSTYFVGYLIIERQVERIRVYHSNFSLMYKELVTNFRFMYGTSQRIANVNV